MDDQWVTRKLPEKSYLSSDFPKARHGKCYALQGLAKFQAKSSVSADSIWSQVL